MAKNICLCDTCGKQVTSKYMTIPPDGWLGITGLSGGDKDFCTLACLVTFATERVTSESNADIEEVSSE
jgi:hypothetical protein